MVEIMVDAISIKCNNLIVTSLSLTITVSNIMVFHKIVVVETLTNEENFKMFRYRTTAGRTAVLGTTPRITETVSDVAVGKKPKIV